MADDDKQLTAQPRTDFGKGAARRYRREGMVPAVMYGSDSPLRHVLLPTHQTGLALRGTQVVLEVSVDGGTLLVAPRDVQRHPVRQDLLHLDLVMLSDAEVTARHAYADAVQRAQALAEENDFDPMAAVHIVEEAYAEGEDLNDVVDNIVETLTEQARAMAAAAAAAAAAEEAEAAAGALEGAVEAGEEEAEEGEES